MRSSSMCPNRTSVSREFSTLGSTYSNNQNIRASSSNISGFNSFTTSKTNNKYAHVKSQVNALSDYIPMASQVKIFHQPLKINAQSKVGSLQNVSHIPAGGKIKIENHKTSFKEKAKPRVETKSTIEIPKSDKKIMSQKLHWKAEPKIGSFVNANHKPAGGNVKIFHGPLHLNGVQSKVGSLDNASHIPQGGNVKIADYKRQVGSRLSRHSNTISLLRNPRSSSSATFIR